MSEEDAADALLALFGRSPTGDEQKDMEARVGALLVARHLKLSRLAIMSLFGK